MIVEDAARLVSKAHEVRSLREAQRHSQALSNRQQQLEKLMTRLERTMAIRKALRETDQPLSPPLVDTIHKLREFKAALLEDVGSALQSDVFAKAQEATDRAVKGYEEEAAALWRRYAAQHLPSAPEEILGALAGEPQSRLTVAKIRRLTQGVARIALVALPSLDDIDEFNTNVAELRAAWAELDVEGLDPAVIDFLRGAASEQGASLDLLTPDVLQWLRDRGADSNYVIRPAG